MNPENTSIKIIDTGTVYKPLLKQKEFKYIDFKDIELNDKSEIKENELEIIIQVITMIVKQSFNDGIDLVLTKEYISKAVIKSFEKKKENTNMEDVIIELENIKKEYKNKTINDLLIALYPYNTNKKEK